MFAAGKEINRKKPNQKLNAHPGDVPGWGLMEREVLRDATLLPEECWFEEEPGKTRRKRGEKPSFAFLGFF